MRRRTVPWGVLAEGVAEAIRALISEKKISAAGVILFLSLSVFLRFRLLFL